MISNPFNDDPIEEVVLGDAPLVKVLVQLRFPAIVELQDRNALVGFQKALREVFPVYRQGNEHALVVADGKVLKSDSSVVHRFSDVDGAWIASLTPEWVALETTSYTTRDEFVARWSKVVAALSAMEQAPAVYDRLGVRYIDQLTGEDATVNLRTIIRHEVLGALALEDSMPEPDQLIAAITQAHFRLDGPQLMARWGRLPANAAMVPGLAPIPQVSWILDMDVFLDEVGRRFDADEIVKATEHAARHAYRFFRWAVTDTFIQQRGGQL
jgi:uncharacterized protein (TIGR04255 family)